MLLNEPYGITSGTFKALYTKAQSLSDKLNRPDVCKVIEVCSADDRLPEARLTTYGSITNVPWVACDVDGFPNSTIGLVFRAI